MRTLLGLAALAGCTPSGGTPAPITRSFTLSPAVAGKTTWDLDADGPCTFVVAGSPYTITPLAGFAAVIELWGPGGGSGGIGVTTGGATSGTTSTSSSFTTGGTVMSAGPGIRSVLRINNTGGGTPAAGGTATGGDTNTAGSDGGVATIGSTCIAGDGGAGGATGGGATVTGASATAGVTVAGTAGNAPGGGASGAVHGNATSGSRRGSGGGGGGAKCTRTFSVDEMTVGVARTLTLTAGGAGGTGDIANGAAGADSRAVFT